ncbi:hypothetical protein YDYSG_59130 [Paenibacillus tyrfis]|uniref:rhamnosyltransferase WsaF family glycosyltransferase n=1 Tax=Paenibacillus tyrfis TaxID=1501230 RepID=UPI0024929F9A|nr:hypothetical protein [Paenibacillus tyrfis]GLI09880.1 hypothetical protein YDYSG_59130 [Paenibacillus tyrfis]
MSDMVEKLIRYAKKSRFIKKLYKTTVTSYLNTHIGEITPFNARTVDLKEKRINLIVPSINQEHVFGGISTAIHFFNLLSGHFKNQRIILTDSSPGPEDIARYSEYEFVLPEVDSLSTKQIVAFNDRYNKTVPIGKDDLFIATSWWTAYIAQKLISWQTDTYSVEPNKMVYFIQDYEPGFYQWSSQYVLADSTYKYNGPQIAVFNTALLQDFFHLNGYTFTEQYSFEPKINHSLKPFLKQVGDIAKKKQILIYGRPSVARNAFNLIIEALRVWVWKQPDIHEWSVISAGESHSDIDVGNGIVVKSKGKMSLEDYANTLLESSIGVSLMVSPHPSYPPLEMAHFGLSVITNHYANKDLTSWHDNITSLRNITPDALAAELCNKCVEFSLNPTLGLNKDLSESYVSEEEQFPFKDQLIRGLF